MSKERKFNIRPLLLGANGQPVRELSLSIWDNLLGATGATGVQGTLGATGATGATGPNGNPQMQITSPNGAVWGLTVSNNGVVGTTQVSPPETGSSGASGSTE
jgi:hypothetical protein